MTAIRVTPDISIDDSEIETSAILSTGPGGQNVNKVASAIQLRFDVAGSENLSPDVKTRLLKLAGSKATREGEIVIEAKRSRSNRSRRPRLMSRARLGPSYTRPVYNWTMLAPARIFR